MKWLKSFFGICDHKWTHIRTTGVYTRTGKGPDWFIEVMKCELCGEIKSKRIEA